jgi:Sporulation related domain.
MKHTLWSSLTLFTFFLSPLLLAARLNPCEYSSFGFNRVDNINNEPGSAATYGVVLLSGPNLEGAQNAAKKYAELGLTVRVVRDDKVKKNKFKAVAGQFKTRAEAAAHKIEIQEALNLKNLWIIEFTKNLKIVATYKAKTKLKKDPNASGKKEPKNKNPEKKPTNNKKTDDKQTDNKQSDTNLVEKQNSTNEKSTKDSTGEKISSLMNTWNTIMIVYNIGDLRGLNEFIHPKLGVTVSIIPGPVLQF